METKTILDEYKELVIQDNLSIQKKIKQILEALLFASNQPIPLKKLTQLIQPTYPISSKDLRFLLEDLKNEYINRGSAIQLEEIAKGYIFRTKSEFAPFVQQLFKTKPNRLSKSLLEVLSIIAYKQPVTRAEIEEIRGVDCSAALQQLLEKEIIQVSGKLEAPGRPSLYATTEEFLKHFGLKDIQELKRNLEKPEAE